MIGPDGQLYGPGDLSLRSDGKIYGPGDRLIGDGKILAPAALLSDWTARFSDRMAKPTAREASTPTAASTASRSALTAISTLPAACRLAPARILAPRGMPFGGLVLGPDNAILGPTFGPEARIIGPNGQWYRSGELRFNRDGMVVLPDDRVLGTVYGLGGMSYGMDGKIYLPGERAFGQGGLYAGADGKRYGPALGPSGKLYGAGGVVLPTNPTSPHLPAPEYAIGPQGNPSPGYGMGQSPMASEPGYAMPGQPLPAPDMPWTGRLTTRTSRRLGTARTSRWGRHECRRRAAISRPSRRPATHEPAVRGLRTAAGASPVGFGVNPYVRGPRNFFMWGDMVDEQKRKERRPGLVQ